MAPKKKKDASKDADEGPDLDEMNMMLGAQVESLKQRIVMEQEKQN